MPQTSASSRIGESVARANLNNAAASIPAEGVVAAVTDFLEAEQTLGPYPAAKLHAEQFDDLYSVLAELVGVSADAVAVFDSATRAWSAFLGGMVLSRGDRILLSTCSFASMAIAAETLAARAGAAVEYFRAGGEGRGLDELEHMLDESVRLVSAPHIPAHNGRVNPVAAIGALVAPTAALYVVDASQSVGHVPVDATRIGFDALVASGRKYLRGPRGTGFLALGSNTYKTRTVDPGLPDIHAAAWSPTTPPTIRSDARRFEYSERSYSLLAGLRVAARHATRLGAEQTQARVTCLATRLARRLLELPDVTVHSPSPSPCGIVSFSIGRTNPYTFVQWCEQRGISLSVTRAESTPVDMLADHPAGWIRASLHYYNNSLQVDELGDLVEKFIQVEAAFVLDRS